MILLRLLGLAVATGFCGSAALALRRVWKLENGSVGVLVFLLLFTAIQSLLVLAAGLTGTLSLWPLAIAGAVGWGLLQMRKPRTVFVFARPGDPVQLAVLASAALAFASLVVKSFLVGPATGDALQYHLPKIAEWVQAGRFVWGINHDPRQWFSAGFELVETWWVVFLHHDRLIELGGVQMAAIAGAAVYTLAEALDARPGLAAVVYLFVPAVILNATSCGNDLAVAALLLSGYALVASGAPRPLQAFPVLLAVGVKATAIFAALGLLVFACFQARPPKLSRPAAVALTAAGLLLAGFWYARNFAVAGHPLYPIYGSHGEFAWMPQQGGVDPESLQQTMQVLPRRMVDPYPYESMGSRMTGWGWALLPLGLPALLLGLREDRRFRRLALSFAIGACATLACVWFQDANLRFVLWFPALLAVGLARQRAPLWAAAALLAGLLNFSATLVPFELRHSQHLRLPDSLAPTDPVACVFTQSISSYRCYNADFSRRVVYPRSMDELRRSGAKAVTIDTPPEWAAPVLGWPSLGRRFYEVR